MRGSRCEARRRAEAEVLAARLAEVNVADPGTDAVLRQQWYTITGPYLEYRGMPDGATVHVGQTLVTPGEVCLAASPEGVLAAGVAQYDEDGHLTVWSDWSGPATRLCCCGDVRAIGVLVRSRGYDVAPPGGRLAWRVVQERNPIVLPAWATG